MAKKTTIKNSRRAHKAAELVAGGMPPTPAMIEAGYAPAYAKNAYKLTGKESWAELLEIYLPDDKVAATHAALLEATRIDHMVFPLGPDTDEGDPSEGPPAGPEVPEAFKDRTKLTDEEIHQLLESVGCKVRKIVHGETARHVYFWSPDSKARKDGLEMAYKLKGRFAPKEVKHSFEVLNEDQRKTLDNLLEVDYDVHPQAALKEAQVPQEESKEAEVVESPKPAESGQVEAPIDQIEPKVDGDPELDKLLEEPQDEHAST